MLTFITWFHFFISLSLLDVLSSQGVGIAADALQRAQEHVMRKSVISQVPPLGKIALHILGSAALLTMMLFRASRRCWPGWRWRSRLCGSSPGRLRKASVKIYQ